MSELQIRNLDVLAAKEVRIYRVSADGALIPVGDKFTQLDQFGTAIGINLASGYNVSCVGAVSVGGMLELSAIAGAKLTNGVTLQTVDTEEDIIATMQTTYGLEVHNLPVWSREA